MRNVDFCITTMDRYEQLDELIWSINGYYPNARITIADQSEEIDAGFYEKLPMDVRVLTLPYDCGLSYARNTLARVTKNKYKLILEDDFRFNHATNIEDMLTLMDKASIVGGQVQRNRIPLDFDFLLERHGDILYQMPDGDQWYTYQGISYKLTGCVMNFMLVNSEVFYDVTWDENLKLREHQDFFYRLSFTHHKVAKTCDSVIIDNKPKKPDLKYQGMKSRDEFYITMMRKHGINKIHYLTGQVVELKDGKIQRYAIPRTDGQTK